MQTVYSQVYCSTLTGFDYFFLYLLANLVNHLFNSCGVDTSVSYKLMKCKTGNFPAHRIECRKDNCLRSIIDNNLNSCSSLKSPDITTFTTNDTPLNLIRINVEDSNSIFNCSFGCNTLYSI